MSTPYVLVDRSGPTARVTLDRPDRRNPLSLEMMREATAAIRDLGRDPTCGVVVLTGSGPALSAGHEIGEMIDRTLEQEREVFDTCVDLMESIQAIRQPVIAEVQGHAIAAGCQLVATCDLAVAVDSARFGTPGVKIGLFCSTPMVAVSRSIGRKRALQMLLTGETIDAPTALAWGLVNRVVPAAELDAAVARFADGIKAKSPTVVALGKRAFYRQLDRGLADAYGVAGEVMACNLLEADAAEGIDAFLGKRPPVWGAA